MALNLIFPPSGSSSAAAPPPSSSTQPASARPSTPPPSDAESSASGQSPGSAGTTGSQDGVRFDLSDAARERVRAADLAGGRETPAAAGDEDRARAWAIRAMDREKLLSLIGTLNAKLSADPAEKEVARTTLAQPIVQIAPSAERPPA